MCYFRFRQDQSKVRLGEYDFNDSANDEKTFSLSSMKIHEAYNAKTYENDIAILKLSQDVQFGNNIQPACLPEQDLEYNNVRYERIFLVFLVSICL